MRYNWPEGTAFGRVVSKTKLYAHGGAGARVKRLFVDQVERVVWAHKLSPETIRLKATKSVPEIEVLRVELKVPEVHGDVLDCIDRAIPYPTLLELHHARRVKLTAAYKRPSEAEKGKWVVGEHGEGSWIVASAEGRDLPVALDLGALYRELLIPLMPFPPARDETTRAWAERVAEVKRLDREIGKLEGRIRKERQFNRKVQLKLEVVQLKKIRNENVFETD